jgi:hypothetical protein
LAKEADPLGISAHDQTKTGEPIPISAVTLWPNPVGQRRCGREGVTEEQAGLTGIQLRVDGQRGAHRGGLGTAEEGSMVAWTKGRRRQGSCRRRIVDSSGSPGGR